MIAIHHIAPLLAAYIDPGTGSMLFTVLIGLVSAGIYGLRTLLVKARFTLSGGRHGAKDESRHPFVVFAEGKQYWSVFEPVCDEFERRGIPLDYLTASPDDPALDKAYEHVACTFIGEGNRAFAHLNMLKADVVLATTPGLDVYQWKRSRDVRHYAHVLHAISDATMYRMFGLDYYDSVLLSGQFQIDQIRQLEALRGLPAKETPLVGLTYMDAMRARLAAAEPLPKGPTTILLAPSWGPSAIFSLYGGRVIEALLNTGHHVVVRPHPQSFTSESDMLEKLMRAYPASEQLEWNRDTSNFDVLRRADVLVSDFSGVIFDFSLVFDKPVIYTEPAFDSAPYDACWLNDEPWTFTTLPKIGRQLTMDSLDSLADLIDECLHDPALQAGRDAARAECWANQGHSAQAVVDYLVEKRDQLTADL